MISQRGHRVEIRGVSHSFGATPAVSDINLTLGGGEMVALLGPSGCGKSTLLRIVAGFIAQNAGQILFDDEPVDHVSVSRRRVGIVFQNYALFPHMTVRQNVAYGLQARNWPRQKIEPRVEEMLDLVHMRRLADRRPGQLSGGQQQRVALARCLAIDPKVLLLDEPFGALDKNLRLDMQIEVKRLQRAYGITALMVTHDQEEALSMADRIAVMNRGRIEQVAPPDEIYDHPANLFVNQFVGAANLLESEVFASDSGSGAVRIASGQIVSAPGAAGLMAGLPVSVTVRPERLRIHDSPADSAVAGTVRSVMPLGPHVAYEIDVGAGISIKVVSPRGSDSVSRAPGQRVYLTPTSPDAYQVFARDTAILTAESLL